MSFLKSLWFLAMVDAVDGCIRRAETAENDSKRALDYIKELRAERTDAKNRACRAEQALRGKPGAIAALFDEGWLAPAEVATMREVLRRQDRENAELRVLQAATRRELVQATHELEGLRAVVEELPKLRAMVRELEAQLEAFRGKLTDGG